jgi:hypothetical protein
MLYLLDANVLIAAHNTYYPVTRVPEFWSWLIYNGQNNQIKIPLEMMEEIKAGHKDPLLEWICKADTEKALLLEGEVDAKLVQHVVKNGYAEDLTDDELEQIGRDPFLIAYAIADIANRCVVTIEVSAPTKKRQNRKIPDICQTFGVQCCNPFELYSQLGFSTGWRS